MKKNNLEKMIVSAYKSETPDLKSKILESCAKETQAVDDNKKRKASFLDGLLGFNPYIKNIAAVALFIMVFAVGIALGRLVPYGNEDVVSADTGVIVYLDVNPSIELHLDGENKVVRYLAANKEAEQVLSDLEIEGVCVNTAINAIVGSMYVQGYLDEHSDSMLLTVSSIDESTPNNLLLDITKNITSVFDNLGMKGAIIAQCLSVDEELRHDADQYGISVGKMQLLRKISDDCGGLSTDKIEVLSCLSIKDLSLMYSQKPNDGDNDEYEYIIGEISVSLSKDEALAIILEHLDRDGDDISSDHCLFRVSRYDNSKVVYVVTLKFYDDSRVYRYEVDLQSGELTGIENKLKK